MKYLLTGGLILARILLYAQDTCVAKQDYWRLSEIARVTPTVLADQDTVISLLKQERELRLEEIQELRKVGTEQQNLYLSANKHYIREKRLRPLWVIGGAIITLIIVR